MQIKKTIYICYYCNLENNKVEAGGIHYCPNDLCVGPGAGYFRSRLKSYKEEFDGGHTIDENEWLSTALKNMAKEKPDVLKSITDSGYLQKFIKEMESYETNN